MLHSDPYPQIPGHNLGVTSTGSDVNAVWVVGIEYVVDLAVEVVFLVVDNGVVGLVIGGLEVVGILDVVPEVVGAVVVDVSITGTEEVVGR